MKHTAWIATAVLLALGQASGAAAVPSEVDFTAPYVTAIRARADKSDVEAMLDMASLAAYAAPKVQVPTPVPDAQAWMERAAATGDAEALYVLGDALGHEGLVVPDAARSAALIRQAAEKGNGTAVCKENAAGAAYPVPHGDTVERLRWDMCSDYAGQTAEMARLRQAGLGAHLTDERGSFVFLSQLLARGDESVLLFLAEDYLGGRGVAPDRFIAEVMFRRMAWDGDSGALLIVADHYDKGDLGPGRQAEAKAYYQRAAQALRADASHTDGFGVAAQTQLAALYAEGKLDAPQPGRKALYWYDRAANNNGRRLDGNTDYQVTQAQRGLGELYYAGKVVSRDYAKALVWLELGAGTLPPDDEMRAPDDTADPDSATLTAEINDCRAHLTPAELAKVAAAEKAWHAVHEAKAR